MFDRIDREIITPFIADQSVLRLTAPAKERRDWLGLNFSWRRWKTKRADGIPAEPNFESQYAWEEVPDRWALFSDASFRLLCVVDDAGLGKSRAMEQIAYARQQADRGHLVIYCEYWELPLDWTNYRKTVGELSPFLQRKLRQVVGDDVPEVQLQHLIDSKMRLGQLSLIIDAIDQLNAEQNSNVRAAQLAIFLQRNRKLRCVISGRPFAVGHYWEKLFAACGREPQDQWELVQLAEFTKDQTYQFLGKERADKLTQLQAEVLAMPRDLETIARLDINKLEDLRTSADVHWVCLEEALNKAVSNQLVSLDFSTALRLFSLLAFETVSRGIYAGVSSEKAGLEGTEFDDFVLDIVTKRQQQITALQVETGAGLKKLLGQLGAINLVLDPGIVRVDADTNPGNPSLRQLYFRHRTLQDFLASIWLLRYSKKTPADRTWLKQRKYVQGDGAKSQEHKELYQVWKFVCEMPDNAQTKDRGPFLDLATSLLLPSDRSEYTVRSTEMMWRCWPGLLRMTDEKVLPVKWYEEDLEAPTLQLQREARNLVETNSPIPAAGSSARATLLQFFAEYHRWRLGRHSCSTSESREAAEEFESGFVLIPPNPASPLETWLGNEHGLERRGRLTVLSIVRRFVLHRYPVTNSVYDLFDATHALRFGRYTKYSDLPLCPCIELNWYDGFMFARWCGGTLPNEIEWEYACRAAPGKDAERTDYCFGNDPAQLGAYAWYIGNSRGKLHAVKSNLASEQKRSNAWGLYHMHGSVWEWCRNWYTDSVAVGSESDFIGMSRCLRGGCFRSSPGLCRSARRNGYNPSDSSSIGVRVSRAASD
jgi:formylglycine-generating enzyme required for sulfatase activity